MSVSAMEKPGLSVPRRQTDALLGMMGWAGIGRIVTGDDRDTSQWAVLRHYYNPGESLRWHGLVISPLESGRRQVTHEWTGERIGSRLHGVPDDFGGYSEYLVYPPDKVRVLGVRMQKSDESGPSPEDLRAAYSGLVDPLGRTPQDSVAVNAETLRTAERLQHPALRAAAESMLGTVLGGVTPHS